MTRRVLHTVFAATLVLGLGAQSAQAEPPALAKGEAEAATLTQRARKLIHGGDLKAAEKLLQEALVLRQKSLESLYELARVKFASGDYNRSRAACKALEAKDPNATLTNVCMARAFLVFRRASRAQEYLDKARVNDPNQPEVMLATADMLRVTGQVQASKAAYEHVLQLDSNNADAYFGLGQLCLVAPDSAGARRAFREALAREPEWPDAQYELGRLLDGGAEALVLLDKVVSARPKWTQARLALGEARLRAGELPAAEALLREVLKASPGDALAHARLGMVLEAKHDLVGAEGELKLGLRGVPNDTQATLCLARVYAQTDRAEDAFTMFGTAASLERESPGPFIEAGVFAMQAGRNALAQAFLEKAVERAPKSAEAQTRYADVLLARGEKAKAKEHYELALGAASSIDREAIQQHLNALK